ncbi:Gfo/Idh/MocA family oxidoreductase [Zhouia spongiae]|uniref:Gfo/Idh/MocA family oxidoreductase n=1 Tax=Zhouia spongiae TaxID=2202721 RepID=A0ABY3YJD5_9FLAO|nr:Gfo/Idh/MocA family oxidoreductase [Zhouia spongiae]UNY97808.1 Gfo/Idh/MocA family oxidoreductase [Zhouia spongiae]
MNNKYKKIRWGIIGLGNIAEKFAEDMQAVDSGLLYAVGSRNSSKARNFAEKHHVQKAYDSYAGLLKDENIDAVYIATPHSLHKENALACLKNKKAVLCEKPLAMNEAEVKEMIYMAKSNNVLLMEAMWTYFLPHYRYVLELLDRNEFGKLKKLEADFGFKSEFDKKSRLFDKKLGGGSLLDIGIYPVFAALSVLGVPDKIDATAHFLDNNIDTQCQIKFTYPDQVIAQLKSTVIENTPTTATFYCEHGIIKINKNFYGPTTVSILSGTDSQTVDFGYHTKGYTYEIEHFNRLLIDGKKESPVMSHDFSLRLIKTLDQIRDQIGLKY